MPTDLLDEVGFSVDVDSKGRYAKGPAVPSRGEREAQVAQDAFDLAVRHDIAEQPV